MRTDDQEESSMVINLSSAALDDDEIKLLSRGLSFCPTPRQVNSEAVLDDLEGYSGVYA